VTTTPTTASNSASPATATAAAFAAATAAASAAASRVADRYGDDEPLPMGCHVQLQGLMLEADFNGSFGYVCGAYDGATQRRPVRVTLTSAEVMTLVPGIGAGPEGVGHTLISSEYSGSCAPAEATVR
ncbi:MAG: hypothetical protein NWR45_10710, partial [Candidatus Nanopelagicales bacterium]|nr:hypothetical protein [Candidatus Nanopelagicales bacterium]